MSSRRYTFVTVVFEAEYDLLWLQARSMRFYCPSDIVDRIIIVDNSNKPLSQDQRDQILDQYGPLVPLVDFMVARNVVQLPDTSGWWTQQILKLAIANIIRSERYVVLDAKNHLVSKLTRDFIEAPDGRARINFHSFEAHPLRDALERVLRYLSVNSDALKMFATTTTPFVIYTDIAKRLMQDLSERENMPFADVMVARQLTEFFLYIAYIESIGLNAADLYDYQVHCPMIWEHTADAAGCAWAIAQAQEHKTPFFGVHRLAIGRLDPAAMSSVSVFWTSRHLFSRHEEALSFLTKLQRKYRIVWRSRYIGSLPERILKRSIHTIREALLRKG